MDDQGQARFASCPGSGVSLSHRAPSEACLGALHTVGTGGVEICTPGAERELMILEGIRTSALAWSVTSLAVDERLASCLVRPIVPKHAGLRAREHLVAAHIRIVAAKPCCPALVATVCLCLLFCNQSHPAPSVACLGALDTVRTGGVEICTARAETKLMILERVRTPALAWSGTSLGVDERLAGCLTRPVVPNHAGLRAREHLVAAHIWIVAAKPCCPALIAALNLCLRFRHRCLTRHN